MPDRDIRPEPDSPQAEETGYYETEDDIELPPMPGTETSAPDDIGRSKDEDGGSKHIGFSSILGGAALVGALVVGGWFVTQIGSAEKKHPNWQHVAAAAEASDGTVSQFVRVDSAGSSQVLATIEISRADSDRSTLQQVRSALWRNDLITATAALQAGQTMPSASQNPNVRPPQLTADSEVAIALREGRQELYSIELFDCCAEDGDIVELIVNGSSFATVPIMHGGTKLSIPLGRGSNTVTIRGVRDGGGGVTLSFRTSRGEYFAPHMRVGDEHQMEVVVR